MSDDSVEFGGFGPTTPAHPRVNPKPKPRSTARPLTKQKSNGVDPEAGPSQRPARNPSGRSAKRKKEVVIQSEDEVEDNAEGVRDSAREDVDLDQTRLVKQNMVASSDDDEVRHEIENQTNRNGTRAKGRVNGRTQAQQTVKPRTSAQQRQQKRVAKGPTEVQGSEDEENNLEEQTRNELPPRLKRTDEGAAKVAGTGGRGKGQAKRRKDETHMDVDDILGGQDGMSTLIDKIGRAETAVTSGTSNVQDAQVAKLKEKIGRLEKENNALTGQMEELCRVRETEAEALMQRSEEQYEVRIRALEELNMALAERLAKKQPLTDPSKSTVLNFITRDVAEAEKQQLDQQIVKLKNELDETKKKLSLKDKEVNELRQTEQELRFELKAEIERASALAKQPSRQPHPTPRSGYVAEDPKHREAIKLYEDLTNIIVLNIRTGPTVPGRKDEWHFNCCYTHTNESDSLNATTRSLSFTLRSYEQAQNDGESTDWIQYLPTSLDKESEEFVMKLDFLKAAFQFERNQLALFLRTLYTTIEQTVQPDEDEDGETGEATEKVL